MADQIKVTVEHDNNSTEVHFIDKPAQSEDVVFEYIHSDDGGPVLRPKNPPR